MRASPHATREQTGTHVKWPQHERRLFSQESAVMNLWHGGEWEGDLRGQWEIGMAGRGRKGRGGLGSFRCNIELSQKLSPPTNSGKSLSDQQPNSSSACFAEAPHASSK